MKDVHRKLPFEMMADSRRSDRELAKSLDFSANGHSDSALAGDKRFHN